MSPKDTPDAPDPTIEEQLVTLLTDLNDRLASLDRRVENIEEQMEEMVQICDDVKEAAEYLAYATAEEDVEDGV